MIQSRINSLKLVKKIANEMRDFENVKKTVLDKNNTDPELMFQFSAWGHDLDLSSGYPALVLLFAELDRLFPEEKWDEAAHKIIIKIKEKLEEEFPYQKMSLFGGLSGVCIALVQASRKGTRYQRLIDGLHQILLEHVKTDYLNPLKHQLSIKYTIPNHLYEVVNGLSGIGSYLLMNRHLPDFKSLIEEITAALSQISYSITIEGMKIPGWYSPHSFLVSDFDKASFPNGNFNLGLSHGIPGVLAYLSIARLNGIDVPEQKNAIETIASWILSKRMGQKESYFWASKISFEEEIINCTDLLHKSRSMDAWCYGTAGVARTLYIAGTALENKQLQKDALESFDSIFFRSPLQWKLTSPTFCHGISGLLAITHQMAIDTNSHFLIEKTAYLEEILLSYYNEKYPFGFRDFLRCKEGRFAQLDKAGLLEGVTGIILSILSIHTPSIGWMCPFLINHRIDHG